MTGGASNYDDLDQPAVVRRGRTPAARDGAGVRRGGDPGVPAQAGGLMAGTAAVSGERAAMRQRRRLGPSARCGTIHRLSP